MSIHKLSAQQTLGLLIKKRDVAFKRGYTSIFFFNVAHVWRVIYTRRVADSPRVVLCGKLAAIFHCHIAVYKKYGCATSPLACGLIYIQFPLTRLYSLHTA